MGAGPMSGRRPVAPACERSAEAGWTLIELLMLIALIGVLAAIAIPMMFQTIERAKYKRCISDMRMIEFEIEQFDTREGRFPNDFSELKVALPIDPWGRPYRYFLFQGPGWRGRARKDRFLVPINTYYDLYSVGIDGDTQPQLQNPVSHDDIVRANDGYFYGYGRDF
jgi:general secretion pathway protein G